MIISIVTPIYKGKGYLAHLHQMIIDCHNDLDDDVSIEWIISNDNPDDEIDYNDENKIVDIIILNSDENQGIHAARKEGLSASHGDYILFLDQDDIIYPEYLKSQIAYIGGADAVICMLRHDDHAYYESNEMFRKIVCRQYLLGVGNSIVSPGQVLIRRSSIPALWTDSILQYNGSDDYLLWLTMLLDGCRFVLNEEILFEHTINMKNASLNLFEMMKSTFEVLDIAVHHPNISGDDERMLSGNISRYDREICILINSEHRAVTVLRRIFDSAEKFYNYVRENGDIDNANVAVYGAGIVGKAIAVILERYGMNVMCFIDRNAEQIVSDIPVYYPDSIPFGVDLIITSITGEIDEINNQIRKNYPKIMVISVEYFL